MHCRMQEYEVAFNDMSHSLRTEHIIYIGDGLLFTGGEGEAERDGEANNEEGRESEGKLSMKCWNVCGWRKGGRQIDQINEGVYKG